jgi:hypothetical protein
MGDGKSEDATKVGTGRLVTIARMRWTLSNITKCIAVSIFPLITSTSNAFPPSTVIIEQYRPPLKSVLIGV